MTTTDIVAALTAGETTIDKIKARVKEGKMDALDAIDAIQQFEQSRKNGASKDLTVKTSVASSKDGRETKGGCVCVYGVNARFPVSTYPTGWIRLTEFLPAVLTHIATTDAWSSKPGEDRKAIKARAAELSSKIAAALK